MLKWHMRGLIKNNFRSVTMAASASAASAASAEKVAALEAANKDLMARLLAMEKRFSQNDPPLEKRFSQNDPPAKNKNVTVVKKLCNGIYSNLMYHSAPPNFPYINDLGLRIDL